MILFSGGQQWMQWSLGSTMAPAYGCGHLPKGEGEGTLCISQGTYSEA